MRVPWGDFRFRRGPLLHSISLDGSETVAGLRQLDRSRRGEAAKTALGQALEGLTSFHRNAYRCFKGPFLEELSVQDLKAQPRPWRLLFAGHAAGQAYNVPGNVAMLQERVEENTVTFLANYLRLAALLAVLSMAWYPFALIGFLCMACLVVLNWPAFMAALQQQQQQQQGQQQQAQRQQGVQPRQHSRQQQTPTSRPQLAEQVSTVRSIGTVVAYAVILTSRCLLFLPRCLLWAVLPILLHAALRRASSEYLPAKQVAGRKGLSDAELAARMAAGPEPAMPGVPFSKVLGLQKHTAGEDPRRVFRELGTLSTRGAASTALLAWHFLRYWGENGQEWLQSRLQRAT